MASLPRILVVDDEEGVRSFLAAALTDEGYDVRTAVDGIDALDAMRRWSPDLVLVDLIMPRMHGWDFARAVRAERAAAGRRLRVVLMTAAGPPAQRAAWDATPDEVLPKRSTSTTS